MIFRKRCMLVGLLSSLAFVPLRPANANEGSDQLVVLAGKSFPASNISFAALKSAFRGQHVEIAGRLVVPINHPEASPLRVAFDRVVLGLDPVDVGNFWIDMRIRDQGRPPKTASTPELALGVVSALPGALTYAAESMLRGRMPLKVLTVNDKSVGDPGYPLRR